jgi:hypothetical protein
MNAFEIGLYLDLFGLGISVLMAYEAQEMLMKSSVSNALKDPIHYYIRLLGTK